MAKVTSSDGVQYERVQPCGAKLGLFYCFRRKGHRGEHATGQSLTVSAGAQQVAKPVGFAWRD